jgi:hypothetical protein
MVGTILLTPMIAHNYMSMEKAIHTLMHFLSGGSRICIAHCKSSESPEENPSCLLTPGGSLTGLKQIQARVAHAWLSIVTWDHKWTSTVCSQAQKAWQLICTLQMKQSDCKPNTVKRLLDSGQFRGIHVMCTINALCLDSLDQLLECILQWKTEYGRDAVSFTLNILRFPSFQSPLILPDASKTHYKTVLETWLTQNSQSEFLHEHEINHLQRLIDYLDVVKTPHSDAFEMPKLLNDFKQFYTQYDQRRNKDFGTAFPNLIEWYNEL